MFSFLKKKKSKTTSIQTRTGVRQYRQVAVTPAAHAKLTKLARSTDRSIIDTVDDIVGV